MERIALLTDSVAGITKEEGRKDNIWVIPMSFIINGKLYTEGVDIEQNLFYERLEAGAEVTTSQPSPGDVMDVWDALLRNNDRVIYITLSGALSKSYETAVMLSQDYDGRVLVVDSRRVSAPQRQLVMDAAELIRQGLTAEEIAEKLRDAARISSTFITVDTLKYLKKGGRITAAAALLGTVLQIKPVLILEDKQLDAYDKVRGMKAGRRAMLAAVRQKIEEDYKEEAENGDLCIQMAYSCLDEDVLADWEAQIKGAFPGLPFHRDPLPLITACHIGPNALGVAVSKQINKNW